MLNRKRIQIDAKGNIELGRGPAGQREIIQEDTDRRDHHENERLFMPAQQLWQMGPFTRLTNGFSKKIENHEHALAHYFMYYNFCRIHQTLRVTPAMEAGVSDHVWSLDEVIALL